MSSKRFSFNVPDDLHRKVKMAAVEHDTTIQDMVVEGLKLVLKQYERKAKSKRNVPSS